VLLFKDDSLRDELAFARSLSGHQRRTVHLVAQRLGLDHKSVGEADSRHVVVFKGGDSDGQRVSCRYWCWLRKLMALADHEPDGFRLQSPN
jgi:hypothetical protein